MTPIAAFLISLTLFTFVTGQLLLKHAMEKDFRSIEFVKSFAPGLVFMAFSFFVTLGLLQRFDLSYLYPFQGLSVVIISVLAAALLRERFTFRVFLGASLISAGVVLVSLS